MVNQILHTHTDRHPVTLLYDGYLVAPLGLVKFPGPVVSQILHTDRHPVTLLLDGYLVDPLGQVNFPGAVVTQILHTQTDILLLCYKMDTL